MSERPAAADDPVRVRAVVSGRLAASSRFRVLQHVDPLRQLGVDVDARPPRVSKYASVPDRWARRRWAPLARLGVAGAKWASRVPAVADTWRADVTWLEREMVPGRVSLEPLLHRPLVFDVDDAIWLLSPGHERAARWAVTHAAAVVAGNDTLAEWARTVPGAGPVHRVWTGLDTTRFRPRHHHETAPTAGGVPLRREGEFVVGWTGSSSTLHFLEALEPVLGRVLVEIPDAVLVVMADRAPHLASLPVDRVRFVAWDPEAEAEVPRHFDVGLAPLRDTPWSRGKCAFKLVQYLACGIPVVAAPYGMNGEVLTLGADGGPGPVGLAATDDDEWVEALRMLHRDPGHSRDLGRAARAVAEAYFAQSVITPKLAAVLAAAAGRSGPPEGGSDPGTARAGADLPAALRDGTGAPRPTPPG